MKKTPNREYVAYIYKSPISLKH